jgi:lipopolysaccharide biosynthesis glycosyltransferase
VDLVLGADDAYAVPLTVAALSAAVHTREPLTVHVLDGGLTGASRRWIGTSLRPVVQVQFHRPPAELLARLPLSRDPWATHISRAMHLRLFAARLLPERCERALYLDADVLVLGDLGPLWRTRMDGALAAAVRDKFVPCIGAAVGLAGLPWLAGLGRAPYFNSGMLLLDLRRWREEDVTDRLLRVLAEHGDRFSYPDQDALNAVLVGRWCRVGARWNALIGRADRGAGWQRRWNPPSGGPSVVHFVGRTKPWLEPDIAYADSYAPYLQAVRCGPPVSTRDGRTVEGAPA